MNKFIYFLGAAIFINTYAHANVEVEGFPNKVKLNSSGTLMCDYFLPTIKLLIVRGKNSIFPFLMKEWGKPG